MHSIKLKLMITYLLLNLESMLFTQISYKYYWYGKLKFKLLQKSLASAFGDDGASLSKSSLSRICYRNDDSSMLKFFKRHYSILNRNLRTFFLSLMEK